jgi:hypothetical protein
MWTLAPVLEVYNFIVLIRYRYKYIVDGVWHVDPSATTELDDLGFQNNVLVVDPAQVHGALSYFPGNE